MDESKVLHLYYTNHRGETRLRKVTPLSIHFGVSPWHPKEQWLMEVIDAETGEARTFTLEGILRHQFCDDVSHEPMPRSPTRKTYRLVEIPKPERPSVFWIDDEEEDVGVKFCCVDKEYFDSNGHLEDPKFRNDKDLPPGFYEVMESQYRYEGKLEEGVRLLKQYGFTQIDNPF